MKEPSLLPLREIKDIHNVEVNSLRAVNKNNFLKFEFCDSKYVEWNNNYGSFSVNEFND